MAADVTGLPEMLLEIHLPQAKGKLTRDNHRPVPKLGLTDFPRHEYMYDLLSVSESLRYLLHEVILYVCAAYMGAVFMAELN